MHIGARKHTAGSAVQHLARLEVGDGVEAVGAALETELLGGGAVGVPYLHVRAVRGGAAVDVENLVGRALQGDGVDAVVDGLAALHIYGRTIKHPFLCIGAVVQI